MRSFPSSYNNKYILVTVDYISKWVDATALPTNDAKVVLKFLRKNIFTRFGIPQAIISDEDSPTFATSCWMLYCLNMVLHIKFQQLITQTSGQAEISNRDIKWILEKIVNTSRKDWVIKLNDALWAILDNI